MSGDKVFDHAVDATVTAVTAVTGFTVNDLPLDLDELGVTWLRLDRAAAELGVLVTELAVNVGEKLADMPYERTDGYQLSTGDLIHHAQRSTTRWRGRDLLTDLSTELIDPDTGEQVAAIPTAVLGEIIPGTATDQLTSSNWRIGGLSNLGIDPDDYRTREWKPARAQKGPGR